MILLQQMQDDAIALRNSYLKLAWYQRLFFPRALSEALINLSEVTSPEPSRLLPVYRALFAQAFSFFWLFQRWIFPSLQRFSGEIDTAISFLDHKKFYYFKEIKMSSLYYAYKKELLNGELAEDSFKAITSPSLSTTNSTGGEAYCIVKGLLILQKAGLLTKKNIAILTVHRDRMDFSWALKHFWEMNLLSGEYAQINYDALAAGQHSHWDIKDIIFALRDIKETDLLKGELAQATILYVVKNKTDEPKESVKTLRYNEEILALGSYAKAFILYAAENYENKWWDDNFLEAPLKVLIKSGLLANENGQANFNLVINHPNPKAVTHILKILRKNGLLNGISAQSNFTVVANYQDTIALSKAIEITQESGLLKGAYAQANFQALTAAQYPVDLLSLIGKKAVITQDDFIELVAACQAGEEVLLIATSNNESAREESASSASIVFPGTASSQLGIFGEQKGNQQTEELPSELDHNISSLTPSFSQT